MCENSLLVLGSVVIPISLRICLELKMRKMKQRKDKHRSYFGVGTDWKLRLPGR